MHLNPLSGRWRQDSATTSAMSARRCCTARGTRSGHGDLDFLRGGGAEMMLEIARFWSSPARWDPACSGTDPWRHGPGRFHESIPAPPGGPAQQRLHQCDGRLDLRAARRSSPAAGKPRRRAAGADRPPRRGDRAMGGDEPQDVRAVPRRGIISQFEGYGDLEDLDWDGYRSRYGNIQRLDRILRAEGEIPNRFKAAKQADTVMLHFLFPDAELQRLFDAARLRVRRRTPPAGRSSTTTAGPRTGRR